MLKRASMATCLISIALFVLGFWHGNSGVGGGQYLRQANMLGVSSAVTPANYYIPGTGNPAVSTADYYHIDGLYALRPYDLTTFGSTGTTIAASRGKYFWPVSPDHPNSNYSWINGMDFYGGYSNDPGVLPSVMNLLFRYNTTVNAAGQTAYFLYQFPYLVYNPDDVTFPFYLYGEGQASGVQHEEGLAQSADLISWTQFGPTHLNTVFAAWSSFQRVVRVGVGNWTSHGLATFSGSYGGYGNWAGSTATSFTQSSSQGGEVIGNSDAEFADTVVTIGAQNYALVREDAFDRPPASQPYDCCGATDPNAVRLAQYVTLVPIDASFNWLASPAKIRISNAYAGIFPGPTFLQNTAGFVESGILHIYAQVGFFTSGSNVGTVDGATYAAGGGLWQENIDYYTYIVDAVAAANAAPVGVQISCASGVVTLNWYDALPSQTYRVYKGSTSGTQATLVGNVTGLTTTDSPTAGQQWWYKVVTLNSGTEEGSRVVHCYVSSHSALANVHINRVIDDGGDVTAIDQVWLDSVISFLSSNSLTSNLLFWTDPAFGYKHSGTVVQKVYDLGTTILPRGGDYTPNTANVTYSATGMNGTTPGWTNPNTTDQGYFGNGRLNTMRRKVQITAGAAYKKPGSSKATLIAEGENFNAGTNPLQLNHDASGNANFVLADNVNIKTASVAVASHTAANIIMGTFNGTNLICYANGTAGTPVTGLAANTDLSLNTSLKGNLNGGGLLYFLGSGSTGSKYTVGTGYVFTDPEAQFTASDLFVFDKALTSTQVTSLTSLLRTRIGP